VDEWRRWSLTIAMPLENSSGCNKFDNVHSEPYRVLVNRRHFLDSIGNPLERYGLSPPWPFVDDSIRSEAMT
jgi:hypothetical protein